ncbi:hypothetical protein GWK47_008092 [Chionoecetes opilio]|uniref:Uncharacterized protein n=1 Tax=Chionoecetes opilio TaxID=41210 RepID=A0A8J5CNW8_CHIOP|nr:hypothetical protein GWK47_008092 [Chionoecetes opilio]
MHHASQAMKQLETELWVTDKIADFNDLCNKVNDPSFLNKDQAPSETQDCGLELTRELSAARQFDKDADEEVAESLYESLVSTTQRDGEPVYEPPDMAKAALGHISGYLGHKVTRMSRCDDCITVMVDKDGFELHASVELGEENRCTDEFLVMTRTLNKGGLKRPTEMGVNLTLGVCQVHEDQSLKIIGGHILGLLAFKMSDPWENNLSTATELGMAVLHLTNTYIRAPQDRAGTMTCSSSLFFCFSEHQLSSSFPILLERRVELVPSVAVGPGPVKTWK